MIREKYIQRAEELCAKMRELSGINPMENSRKRDIVTARMMVAIVLMQEGCTTMQVAELFGRNHSAIIHYKDRWLGLFMPGWEAERELWEKFKQSVQICSTGKE